VEQITQITAYVPTEKGNTRSRPAKLKLLVPSTARKGDSQMAGESQLLLWKGTERHHLCSASRRLREQVAIRRTHLPVYDVWWQAEASS